MSNIQQTYALLQQMYELMQKIEIQGKQTERQTTRNIDSFKQLESVAMRYMLIARRLGLPEGADAFLQKISMMIMAMHQLRIVLAITKAELIAAGPIGWLAFGASAAYTALSFYSLGNQ